MYCYWHKLTCLIYLNTFICNLWTFFFIKYNNVNKFAEMAIKVLIDWLIDWLIDQLIDWSIDLYCTYLCIKCIYLFVCLFAYLKWSNLSLQFKESNKLINIVICANSTQHINSTIQYRHYKRMSSTRRQNTIKFASDLYSHDLPNHRNVSNVK